MKLEIHKRKKSARIRRREKEEKRIVLLPKHILFVLSFICLVIMFVSYRFPDTIKPVKNLADIVLSPMQSGINHVGSAISGRFKKRETMEELKLENEELKKKVEELSSKARLTDNDQYELDSLRRLYDLDTEYPDLPKTAARIIARESNGWYDIFTIDKGSDDGICVNMNVIAGNGLVGIVTDVRKKTSVVKSIIDDNSNVSAMIASSGDNCIVNGNMAMLRSNGTIEINMLPKECNAMENEEVLTSRISDKYLSGLLIGYIKNLEIDSSNMTKEALLVPAVDFQKLDNVLVITVLKEKEAEALR
jgi:rod shape-determining protein MreC